MIAAFCNGFKTRGAPGNKAETVGRRRSVAKRKPLWMGLKQENLIGRNAIKAKLMQW